MIEGVSEIVGEAGDTAISVSTTASQLLAASTQIAKGAEQASDQIHHVSSAVEEMAASMAQVSKNAEASAESAQQVLEHVRLSDRSVTATSDGMVRIEAGVPAAAEKMRPGGRDRAALAAMGDVQSGVAERWTLSALATRTVAGSVQAIAAISHESSVGARESTPVLSSCD